jgi:flagellar biosynthetic protein FliR
MFDFIDILSKNVPGYMLVFARISGMVATLPIISSSVINSKVRVIFVFILSMIIFPNVNTYSISINSIFELIFNVSKELLVGLFIGFGVQVIFEAFTLAGGFVGRQMGLGIANVMDPNSSQQVPIVGQFWMFLVVVYFVTVDGHHLFVETIYKNFELIPLGKGMFPPELGQSVVYSGSMAFNIAIRFAAPTIVFLLLVETAVALTVRVMPEMNAFFVSLPLRIGCGIIALIASLNIFQLLFDSVYGDLVNFLSRILLQLRGL